MLDRRHNVLDDTQLMEEQSGHSRVVSEAETAPCNCPELCIRDHDNE
jgi:hypothetical protein